MSETVSRRLQAAAVAVAPAVLLAGFVYHPYVTNGTDTDALADAAAADTTRWGLAHVVIALAYALMALAFLAIRAYLREGGEERWSAPAVPFAVFGSALFVVLPGMEFTLLAAVRTAGDPAAAQDELLPWFVPFFATASVTFGIGAIAFAVAMLRSGSFGRRRAMLVAGSLVVMVLARLVPLGATQILIGIAGLTALWPLAHRMWRDAEARNAVQPAMRRG